MNRQFYTGYDPILSNKIAETGTTYLGRWMEAMNQCGVGHWTVIMRYRDLIGKTHPISFFTTEQEAKDFVRVNNIFINNSEIEYAVDFLFNL